MAVHGYLSLRDSSSLAFGSAVSAAIRWSREEPAHASGELIEGGWLISLRLARGPKPSHTRVGTPWHR